MPRKTTRKTITLKGHETIGAFFALQGIGLPNTKPPDELTPFRELAVAVHVRMQADDLEGAAELLRYSARSGVKARGT
jgi:hypothetical protein